MDDSHAIWIEKYRPQKLSEIIGQGQIIERLQSYVRSGNLPHLLFSGNAGIGKTTTAIALARELFGDNWNMNFREMNASDERGIDVVRNQIKQFARTSPFGESSFKILFLDEADALTTDAQAALRRTMESYAVSCRFILSCNYSSKIIDPIQSRCAIFRFKPLVREDINEEIMNIAKKEGLFVEPDAIDALTYISQGDMRKAINALQGAAILGNKINSDRIFSITATALPGEIEDLLNLCMKKDFLGAGLLLRHLLSERGIAPQELLFQCYRSLVLREIPEDLKVRMIDHIGETDFRLSEGANSDIQMEALIARFVITAPQA